MTGTPKLMKKTTMSTTGPAGISPRREKGSMSKSSKQSIENSDELNKDIINIDESKLKFGEEIVMQKKEF